MNSRFYILIPIVAFALILSNAFFGHMIYGSPYDQDINKYSIYVHLQSEWESSPGNILFDVTTVWSNPHPKTDSESFYQETSMNPSLVNDYNSNQLEFQHDKSFVRLNHEFNNCETSWKPALYRYAIDSVRNYIQFIQGAQLNNDPYVSIYPNISNSNYDDIEQEKLASSGYVQFIPICTYKDFTSYQYSVSLNDKNTAFDVYFVPSEEEIENFLKNPTSFNFYSDDGCHATNFQSFTGVCKNVEKNSGILIIIPDNLSLSLTSVEISLHEQV